MKIAGPPLLVILARAMSPCQAYTDGACVLIWPELCFTLSGIIKRDFGGRLLMAAVDAKSFQFHLLEQDTREMDAPQNGTKSQHWTSVVHELLYCVVKKGQWGIGATWARCPHTHLHRELIFCNRNNLGVSKYRSCCSHIEATAV